MSKYLINEPPLLVLPSLAKLIGLNEAILLQQIHYWLKKSKHKAGGEIWVYNTYADWLEQLPFWSEKTLRRIVKRLEDDQILYSTYEFNKSINKTKWYRINYAKLNAITGKSDGTDLIIEEYPLIFQPTLAFEYGLNEAIFLQQLHYWLTYGNPRSLDSYLWVASSYKAWLRQFMFWSEDTLYRTIKKLTDSGIVANTDQYNTSAMDKTRWLTICYDKIPNSMGISQSGQSIPQGDQSIPQSDQTIPQGDQSIPQSDQSIPQSDQSIPQGDQSIPQGDRIDTATCPHGHRNVTSPLYYIDYITETNTEKERLKTGEVSQAPKNHDNNNTTVLISVSHENDCESKVLNQDTQRKIDHVKEDGCLGMVNPLLNDEKSLRRELVASYDTAYHFFSELIDDKTCKRLNKNIEGYILNGLQKYGNDFVEQLFNAVKKSDFLLGHLEFKTKLSWLMKNSDAVIAGKYDNNDKPSVYELAQACSEKTVICDVLQNKTVAGKQCLYCQKFKTRTSTHSNSEKTAEEIVAECSAQPVCQAEKSKFYPPYCVHCPRKLKKDSDSNVSQTAGAGDLKKMAEECYARCGAICAPKIMKKRLMDQCSYCPGNKPDPDKPHKKITHSETDAKSVLEVDCKNTDEIWKTAFKLTENMKGKIKESIRKHMPFTVYSETDLEADVRIIAFEILLKLSAESSDVKISEFEAQLMMGLKSQFKRTQTVPALRDVIKTDDKSACFFEEITDYNSDITDHSDSATDLPFPEEMVSSLVRILPMRQEQVLQYRLGLTRRGALTQLESALIMGTTKENVTILEKKAISALADFVKQNNITIAMKQSRLEKLVATYQQEHIKPVKFDGYFELGNLFNVS